jgi:hypothetical protein
VIVAIDEDLNLYAKDEALVAEFNSKKLHPRVRKIAIVAAQYLYLRGYPGVVTSIRAGRVDGELTSPIHAAWRAIDMRSNTMQPHEAEDVRKALNKRFRYDDNRETVPPLNHGTAPHFHLQVKA